MKNADSYFQAQHDDTAAWIIQNAGNKNIEKVDTIPSDFLTNQHSAIKYIPTVYPIKNEFGASVMLADEFRTYKPDKWVMNLKIQNDLSDLTGVFLHNYGEIEGSSEVFLFNNYQVALYPNKHKLIDAIKYCVNNKKPFSTLVMDHFPYSEDFFNYTDVLIDELEKLTQMKWRGRYELSDLKRMDSIIVKNDSDRWQSRAYAPLAAYVHNIILHYCSNAERAILRTIREDDPHDDWNAPEPLLIIHTGNDTQKRFSLDNIVFRAMTYDNRRTLSEYFKEQLIH